MLDYEIDLLCICILLGMMLQSSKRQNAKARLLFVICLVVSLICSFEIVQVLALQHRILSLLNLSMAFMLPLFCALSYLWYVYIFNLLRPQGKLRGTVLDFISQLIISLLFIFSLTSPWHNLLFRYEGSSFELKGELLWLVLLIPDVFALLSIWLCIRDLRSETRYFPVKSSLIIILLNLLAMTSGFFQYQTHLPLVCPLVTFGLLIYFISMQNTWISKDPLTKLNNRTCLNTYMRQHFIKVAKYYQPYLVYLDINRFKRINDSYGHIAGDLALKIIAEVLMLKAEHTKHFVCRLGGDEFLVVLMVHDEHEVKDFIMGVRQSLSLKLEQEKLPFAISISIGMSSLRADGTDFNEALSLAENKMYSEKRFGDSFA